MNLAQTAPTSKGRSSDRSLSPLSDLTDPEPALAPSFGDCPGETTKTTIQVGCLTPVERIKKRLESKRSASARGKGAKRKQISYCYIEYWFHWKERSPADGQWRGRSCYLGGHPKGQKPRGKLISRLDIVETQYKRDRPYGETLALLGMAEKGNAHRI